MKITSRPVPHDSAVSTMAVSTTLVIAMLLLQMMAAVLVVVEGKNMIDGNYDIANGLQSQSHYSTKYDAEYFDVYSPKIKSLYSQVYWADMEPVKLPQHIIDRFDHDQNKTMAIVGYEIDQVVVGGGAAAASGDEEDVPVPITHAYNHHYMAYMYDSRQGQMVRKTIPPDLKHKTMAHGLDTMLSFEYHIDDESDSSSSSSSSYANENNKKIKNRKKNPSQFVPHAQVFSEGNGGEMRLSYHGYPKGYAQLIQSPDTFQVTPMQIDVWNRDGGSRPKFMPGPLPKSSPAPRTEEDGAIYSGLLECPCSDRLERKIWNHYVLLPAEEEDEHNCHQTSPTCQEEDKIHNATECFSAGQYVLPSPNDAIHHVVEPYDATMSEGCSLVVRPTGVVDMYWNEKKKSGNGSDSNKDHHVDEEYEHNTNLMRVESGQKAVSHRDQKNVKKVVAFASSTLNATVTLTSSLNGDDSKHNDSGRDKAVITLVGPKDVWFGIGWGTKNMCRKPMMADVCPSTGPYAIIVTGDHVEERLLGYHGMGQVLESSVPYMSVISNTVDGGVRTVKVERPLEGLDERYYSFNINATSVDVIMAKGCSETLAQHCSHGTGTLNFLETDTRRTVCGDGELASIGGRVFHEGKRCAPFPQSTLIQQHNPTCSIKTYNGGQHCCHHMVSLLDKDQEIPWDDQPLEYQLKFRFYFEEYVPSTKLKEEETTVKRNSDLSVAPVEPDSQQHQHLVRLYWMTEAHAGEYDIKQCQPGTPTSQCVHVITSQWAITDMLADFEGEWGTGTDSMKADGIELIYAAPHCHAPSCLSIELYNADTGELLCYVEPRPGKSNDKVYDELGFLAIPPCLWSSNKDDGLLEPVFLPFNTTLLSIKRNNSTLSHFGEMASWQMRGVVISNDRKDDNDDVDMEDQSAALKAAVAKETAEEERSLKIRRRGIPN
mmetsp:Transcript_56578/g.137387  ORF Transcript_56578/g.137387 Transcript_56578/m.137387 type:complete len:937 (+) Transcript_56578:126-2936(+)